MSKELLELENPKNIRFLSDTHRRIAVVEDYNIFGSSVAHFGKIIYSEHIEEDIKNIVECKMYDHTMFESIDLYCFQKFPIDCVKEALIKGYHFEVIGVFPRDFSLLYEYLGYIEIEKIQFINNPTSKNINFIRPEFFYAKKKNGKKVLVVAVGCGRDYILHYASMLQHIIRIFTTSVKIKIVRYPLAESSLPIWTGISRKYIQAGDLVLLGYYDEIKASMEKSDCIRIEEIEDDFYVVSKYKNKQHLNIVILGVKFSFWGDISAKIVSQICQLGASEIIYIGKLGSMTSPSDIYSMIYSPSSFLILYHDQVVSKIVDLRNNFLSKYPKYNSGYHVSVPTILEEDYLQRSITDKLNVSSIDNEISQMAFAVKRYCNMTGNSVSFSAIHFATDYIRRNKEKDLKIKFDLSNNRTQEAKEAKEKILNEICEILKQYIEEHE